MKVAMILAAGRGERLKPLTDDQPKALCMVKNKPLIEHHVLNLVQAGFEKLVVNHAYLGGQIRQFLGNGQRYGITICYSPEPPGGLETGGGIVKALPLLGNEPFVTVNADIFTDFNFAQLDLELEKPIHLILTNKNPALNHHGDFSLINQNQLCNENPEYTFSGIAVYHPKVFSQCKQGRYSVAPLIRQLVTQNKVTGSLYQGTWFDIGSMDRLKAADKD
ncbi:N-acetylmuramate alpha-1-phosphate uridylyltransferase MurU [Legionella bononiensis]|uniref:Nucleotidyltransferase family protein n=1 Tax=Legionella bononiensis TaxID=2793102 RepID=A0ABS1WDC0_9GAMM|nr:nucleotidyltransferase family protein [Legionella bononiensis]MBL7481339.1 nucleotidyltransferase family protein [Legionella bononiensis]MBL7527371.1 nucleotidyltransferase family protein [Legionella bononiensis]